MVLYFLKVFAKKKKKVCIRNSLPLARWPSEHKGECLYKCVFMYIVPLLCPCLQCFTIHVTITRTQIMCQYFSPVVFTFTHFATFTQTKMTHNCKDGCFSFTYLCYKTTLMLISRVHCLIWSTFKSVLGLLN